MFKCYNTWRNVSIQDIVKNSSAFMLAKPMLVYNSDKFSYEGILSFLHKI